jgi:chitinase
VFAPYIDMSLYTSQNLAAIQAVSGIRTLTLAFVLDAGNGQVGWGGIGSIGNDTLPNGSSVRAQIDAVRAAGGDVIISFGGANGVEPALTAPNAAVLQARYQSVIDRYQVTSLDFDIEGGAVANQASLTLRDQALIGLKAANPGLRISFTLPVLPTGLDHNGLNVLATARRDGLVPDVVNIMAMDYGPAVDNGGQMGANAISAALHTIDQMRFLGIDSKLGITPMIGVNDVAGEVFTLDDARALVAFAKDNPAIERLSMWSVSRDNGSTAGSPWASPTGSGLAQPDYAFTRIFDTF